MPRHVRPAAVVALAAVLGLLAIRANWTPNRWILSDGIFYFATARGLIEHGSLRQEPYYPASWIDRDLGWDEQGQIRGAGAARGAHGELWPKHSIWMPLVAVPWIWAFGTVGALIFQWLGVCLIALLTFRVASRVATQNAALVSTAVVVATPLFFGQAWGFNNDTFSALFVMGALDAVLSEQSFAAGLLAGLALLVKPSGVLYLPAIAAWFAVGRPRRELARAALGAAGPIAVAAGMNAFMFGAPWITAYQRVATHGGFGSATETVYWSQFGARLSDILFGRGYVLDRVPLFLVALAALVPLTLRSRRVGLLFGWCLSLPLLFYAPVDFFRLDYLVAQVALCAAVLAAWLAPGGSPGTFRPSRRWAIAVGGVLFALLLAGAGRRVFHRPSENVLWERIADARVLQGDRPCDLFHPGLERWECRGLDQEPFSSTGRLIEGVSFGGTPRELVGLAPNPIAERSIAWDDLPLGGRWRFEYGFADRSPSDARVSFSVTIDGRPVIAQTIAGPGLHSAEIDTQAPHTGRVRFSVSSAKPAVFGIGAQRQ